MFTCSVKRFQWLLAGSDDEISFCWITSAGRYINDTGDLVTAGNEEEKWRFNATTFLHSGEVGPLFCRQLHLSAHYLQGDAIAVRWIRCLEHRTNRDIRAAENSMGCRQEVLMSSVLTHFLVVQLSHGIHLASLKERRVWVTWRTSKTQKSFDLLPLVSWGAEAYWARGENDWNLALPLSVCERN